MKTLIITSALFMLSLFSFSQNEVDALRYSTLGNYGTARTIAMGGAFGALGGDVSAMSTNPAGISIYRGRVFSITPTINFNKVQSNYLDGSYTENTSNYNLGNMSFVSNHESKKENGWIGSTFGFGYTILKDFTNNKVVQGDNAFGSMADYFVGQANGNPTASFNPFIEGLAWESYLINELGDNQYTNNFASYGETQRHSINTSGKLSEYLISYSANYNNKFYLGGTFAFQNLDYESNDIYKEFNFGQNLPADSLLSFDYNQNFKASGDGINLKIGAIYRATDWFRLGLAIHTPIKYDIKETYYSSMTANFNDTVITPENPSGEYSYSLTTPTKTMLSLGFIIMKQALISIDYEYINYSTSRFRDYEASYDFFDENNAIQSSYTSASNIKIGGEYSYGTYRFRAGAAYYGSPYNSDHVNSGSDKTQYTCGFGINEKSFFFDVAYVYSQESEKTYIYESPLVSSEPTYSTTDMNLFIATIGIRF